MACIRDDLSIKPEVICIPCNTPMWLVNTFHHQWSGSYFPVFQPGMDLTLLARLLLTYFIVYMITKLMHVRIFDLMCRFGEICVYIVDLSIEEEVWEDKLFCIVLFNWAFVADEESSYPVLNVPTSTPLVYSAWLLLIQSHINSVISHIRVLSIIAHQIFNWIVCPCNHHAICVKSMI